MKMPNEDGNNTSNLKRNCMNTSCISKTDYSSIEKSLEMNETTTKFDLYKGFLFMFISCSIKSVFSILCKLVMERNQSVTSYHMLTFKTFFMMIITLSISIVTYVKGIYYENSEESRLLANSQYKSSKSIFIFPLDSFKLIVVRSVLAVLSVSLTMLALKHLSISNVYAVYYIYPGLTIVLSFILLNERVVVWDYVCLSFCFVGVILVVRPEFLFPLTNQSDSASNSSLMFLFVFLGALLKAFEDIIIRNVGKEVNCFIIPFVYSLVGIILYPVPLLSLNNSINFMPTMDSIDIFLLVSIGATSFVYQTFMAAAIQNENAGRVAMVNYFQVPFMFISDLLIFHHRIVLFDIIGIMMIFSFNFANGTRKVVKRFSDLANLKLSKGKQQYL